MVQFSVSHKGPSTFMEPQVGLLDIKTVLEILEYIMVE